MKMRKLWIYVFPYHISVFLVNEFYQELSYETNSWNVVLKMKDIPNVDMIKVVVG